MPCSTASGSTSPPANLLAESTPKHVSWVVAGLDVCDTAVPHFVPGSPTLSWNRGLIFCLLFATRNIIPGFAQHRDTGSCSCVFPASVMDLPKLAGSDVRSTGCTYQQRAVKPQRQRAADCKCVSKHFPSQWLLSQMSHAERNHR